MIFFQNIKNKGLKTMKLPILLLALTLVYSSCKKDDNDVTPIPTPETATLAVFHGLPTTEALDFYLSEKKVNENLIAFGSEINYVEAEEGTYSAEIKNEEDESLLKESITLAGLKSYSLFIAGDEEEAEYALFNDDLSNPAEGKAKVRFVHLSPDAGKLTFTIDEGDDLFVERDYKTASDFTEIDAETFSFNVVDADDEVLTTVSDFEIEAGKIYTVWVKGLAETENDDLKLEAKVFKNK